MREIKFRAWVTPMGEEPYMEITPNESMLNPIVIGLDGQVYELQDEDISTNTAKPAKVWLPEQLKLMQYIGMKDKNGTEIYEGDIVAYKPDWFDEPDITQVVYKAPGFICNTGHMLSEDNVEIYKVIGNVWENPELLKEQA